MNKLHCQTLFSDTEKTLIGVFELNSHSSSENSACFFVATLKPVALIIIWPHQLRLLGMDGTKLNVEEFASRSPELAELLRTRRTSESIDDKFPLK